MEFNIVENCNYLNYFKWIYVKCILWIFGKFFFCNFFCIVFGYRNMILCLFGVKIGKYVYIYFFIVIWFLWNLEIGDWSVIGEEILIYNLGKVIIGEKVIVSYWVYVCVGIYDYIDLVFFLLCFEICIGN